MRGFAESCKSLGTRSSKGKKKIKFQTEIYINERECNAMLEFGSVSVFGLNPRVANRSYEVKYV